MCSIYRVLAFSDNLSIEKMKLLFIGLSFALADPVAEPSADCNRIEGSHGQAITCSNDGRPKYVTGLCSSAQTTQCGTNGKKSHEYICCDDYEIQPHRHCYNLYGGYGAKLACTNPNDIVVGGCASGRYEDCASGFREELEAQQQLEYESITPYKSSHFIKCCQSGLVLQRCAWRFGHHGEMVKCQNGDVAHGQCASGADADCKAESNLRKYTGLYCCGVKR